MFKKNWNRTKANKVLLIGLGLGLSFSYVSAI